MLVAEPTGRLILHTVFTCLSKKAESDGGSSAVMRMNVWTIGDSDVQDNNVYGEYVYFYRPINILKIALPFWGSLAVSLNRRRGLTLDDTHSRVRVAQSETCQLSRPPDTRFLLRNSRPDQPIPPSLQGR